MSMNPAKKRVRIVSTGSYLPEKVLTNFDLEKMVDTTDEWITTRTGIKRRHIAKESEAITPGQSARLVQLAQSATTTSGFRTNLGLVSACAATITASVSLYRGNGTLIGTKSYELRPYETRQIDRVFVYLTAESIEDGFAVITTASPGARLFAYASVIDNRSGDPIFIPAEVASP